MRILSVLLLCLVLSSAVGAQTADSMAYGYDVRYLKNHLFLQRDFDFNVVDYEIEWPEVMSFHRLEGLKRCITQTLFGIPSSNPDSVLMAYTHSLGAPVKGQLKALPDDRHFCYVTLKAQLKAFSQSRWATYAIAAEVSPGDLSGVRARQEERIVTYDMMRNELLGPDDMVSADVAAGQEPSDFYSRLFAPLDDEVYNAMLQSSIDGVWLDGGNIGFHVQALTADRRVAYEVMMPYEGYNYVLTHRARQLMTRKINAADPYMTTLPLTLNGDTIYKEVEEMPVFPGGQEGFARFWANRPQLQLGNAVLSGSRVLLSYVVDTAGRVRDLRVLSPLSPVVDRYVVSLFRGLTGYTPGKLGGRKVCVRQFLPCRFLQR